MTTPTPIPLTSQPGIKRDGTIWEGQNYSDGVWCRFDARALPKKMGGYSAIANTLPEVSRGLDAFPLGATDFVHSGGQDFLNQIQVLFDSTLGGQTDRTPTSGFTANANNLWQFAQFYNGATGATVLCANPGQNLTNIANNVETPIFYGQINTNSALSTSGMPNVAGGVVALPPYLVGYSINGRLDVSTVNSVTALGGSAFISDTKLIKGLPIRNGSGGPAGIFWSLNQLILATFNAAITTGVPFSFNIISDDVSPLSSSWIIEYQGIYYWADIDHFAMFNGIVRELPNNMSIDFFYDNLNFAYRQKVFVFKVPRWGEIWWCFPKGNSTECNWAVVYNTRLNLWYDTPLPVGFRTAAVSPKVLPFPLMTDAGTDPDAGNQPTLWIHETGTDKVVNGNSIAIQSYIQTHEISPILSKSDKAFRIAVFEPDFVQSGPLSVTVWQRANPNVSQIEGPSVTLPDFTTEAVTLDNQLARFKVNARLLSFRIQSLYAGGDFRMGTPIIHIEETDGRQTQ